MDSPVPKQFVYCDYKHLRRVQESDFQILNQFNSHSIILLSIIIGSRSGEQSSAYDSSVVCFILLQNPGEAKAKQK